MMYIQPPILYVTLHLHVRLHQTPFTFPVTVFISFFLSSQLGEITVPYVRERKRDLLSAVAVRWYVSTSNQLLFA